MKASEPAGLTIIEAPMGEGKSEAALYLATQWLATHGLAGLYVALPTAATANQMFTRVQELMAQHDPDAAEGVRLVHGMSWLIDELSPEEPPEVDEGAESEEAAERALDWFRPTKRSLLAPDGVGTVDQALKGALHVRFGFLRLLGLTGKVLIIDEVHAYDPYMSEILVRLLQWCRSLEIPVILLSATLPADRRISLIRAYDPEAALPQHRHGGYPLITLVYPGTRVEEVPVSRVHQHANVTLHLHRGLLGESERVAHLAADQALAGGCVAVIANTVNSAQAIYRALKRLDLPPDLILRLFHARFPAGRRQEIEAEVLTYFDKRSLLPLEDPNWKERPKRAILVATQVVEQSLDLDFDTMITELAPIDLLLQRTGRLHRHRRPGRDGQPVLHVLLPHEGADGFGATVYEPYFLMRTLQVLEKDQVWQLPALIRQLVEDVYAPPADGPSDVTLGQAYQAYLAGRKTDVQMADSFLLKAPSTRAFDAWLRTLAPQEDDEAVSSYLHAKTRKGDDSVRLLVVGDEPWQTVLGQRRSPGRDLLREIYLHTLNAPDWWFKWVTPATGYEPVGDAPLWLPGTKVLRLKAGEWHGSDRKGHPVVIRLSDEYGLYRLQGEGEHAHL
ncbi:MAG: CRISPR-associated helicase Cas3' [Bacillota bacterium]